MTLEDVYVRLLDAHVTEHAGGFASRAEVREALEKHLDAAQPVEKRAETWGAQVAADQFAQMKAAAEAATERRRKAREARKGGDGT